MPVSTEEILLDLKRCGSLHLDGIISRSRYKEAGKFGTTVITSRFGSWNSAVEAAGFQAGKVGNYTDEMLFENLLAIWEAKGRQPRRTELAFPPSKISQGPYLRRFRSWTAALHEFVEFANRVDADISKSEEVAKSKRTSRTADLRLRFRVLTRDSFRCRACGKSPSAFPGLHLHVDHITAWSKGGETIFENLQTLCEPCNLGKSNVL